MYFYSKILFQVIYVGISILSYQQLPSFSQGKSKYIYKKSKTTALLKYYYLINLSITISNWQSAISGQRSAVSGQWSAVGSQRSAISDHSCRSLRHAQLSFAMPASSNITASAVISAV